MTGLGEGLSRQVGLDEIGLNNMYVQKERNDNNFVYDLLCVFVTISDCDNSIPAIT